MHVIVRSSAIHILSTVRLMLHVHVHVHACFICVVLINNILESKYAGWYYLWTRQTHSLGRGVRYVAINVHKKFSVHKYMYQL